ncbi:MAG: MBL fold metallo-hydrolase [Lachnospiraceae bacterium]|nr:MBL fold metallo-hydrolase [Lachnospiraceae bacterium]
MKLNKKILFSACLIVLIMIAILTGYLVKNEPWRTDKDGFEITQFGTVTGSQCMFYTIRDKDGNLVVIDGGYTDDEASVANVINRFGGHVKSWILTHPHPDHIGAFNALYPKLSAYGITVDKIYVTDVNHDRYVETAKDYDAVNAYLDFLNVTKDAKNVKALKENDEFDLLPGLHMKVLHGWDKNVDATENNLCNNGSLMFKLTAKEESMLFCADTQHEMEKYIVGNHKDELKCDYVQCGHHGNWGLTPNFYKLTNAKAAFVDGPNYLYDSKDTNFDGYKTVDYFREAGARIYRLASNPNVITLK